MRAQFNYLVRLTDLTKAIVIVVTVTGFNREDALLNAKFQYPHAKIELVSELSTTYERYQKWGF